MCEAPRGKTQEKQTVNKKRRLQLKQLQVIFFPCSTCESTVELWWFSTRGSKAAQNQGTAASLVQEKQNFGCSFQHDDSACELSFTWQEPMEVTLSLSHIAHLNQPFLMWRCSVHSRSYQFQVSGAQNFDWRSVNAVYWSFNTWTDVLRLIFRFKRVGLTEAA